MAHKRVRRCIIERSDSLVELAKALNKFQAAMKSVKKESVHPYFHSKYADLDAVWEAIRKPLAENGLAVVQGPTEIDGKLALETLLLHISGEYVASRYPLVPMKEKKDVGWVLSDDPQSLGSVITYARRYALSAMLGISVDEDDDAEGAMKRDQAKPEAKSSKPLLDQAREIVAAGPAPECECGKPRVYRSGISKATNQPYRGWYCPTNRHAVQWIPTTQTAEKLAAKVVAAALAEPEIGALPESDDLPWDDEDDDPRGDPTQLTPQEKRML